MSKLIHYSGPAGSYLLPPNYQRLSYIQSTGSQWVDCGVKANQNTKIYGKFYALSGGHPLFGARAAGVASAVISIWPNTAADTHRFHDKTISVHTPLNQFLNCDVSKNGYRLNGTNYQWGTVADFTSAVNIHIFASASDNIGIEARCYAFRIWNGNTIVRDMVPVKKSDGTIGFLDLVNNTFYGNSGTGTFIAGPECPQGFPTSEYCQVEYLQSDGNAYFNTGLTVKSNTITKLTMQSVEATANKYNMICGYATNTTWQPYSFGTSTTVTNLLSYGGTLSQYTVPTTMTTVTFTSTNSEEISNSNIQLFGIGGNPGDYPRLRYKLYRAQILEGTTIKQDWIPCYRRSDMCPGMYDIVGRQFKTNAGTGEFLLGPSITFGWGEVMNGSGLLAANPYDKQLYVEPDGSKWMRIFHHNNPNVNGFFESSDTFNSGVYKNENKWFAAHLCNSISGNKFEFMIKQCATLSSTIFKYRWVQFVNPMNVTTAAQVNAIPTIHNISNGYSTSASNYTGLMSYSGTTRLCSTNAWWGAIGEYTAYGNNTIPAWNGLVITTGYYDLYLRIDDNLHYTLPAIPHNISTGDGKMGEKNSSFYGGGNGYLEFDSLPATSVKTVAFWVKSNKSNQCFYADPTAKTACGFYNNYMIISCNSNYLHTFPITAFTADAWNHITITYGSTPEVWINGVKQIANAVTDYWSWAGSSKAYLFARYNDGFGQFSSGYIQDFQIWDEIKNPAELM